LIERVLEERGREKNIENEKKREREREREIHNSQT
jgi:hypothetical protein